jgi:hypothetical protein
VVEASPFLANAQAEEREKNAPALPLEELQAIEKQTPRKKKQTEGKKRNPPGARAPKERVTRAHGRKMKKLQGNDADDREGMRSQSNSPITLKATEAEKHWGSHTFAKRWTRERSRNRWIAEIPIGSVIERKWAERTHVVKCEEGFWTYEGKKYPTLYSVVEAITGARTYPAQIRSGKRPEGKIRKMANWSARKFFQLDDLLPRSRAGS